MYKEFFDVSDEAAIGVHLDELAALDAVPVSDRSSSSAPPGTAPLEP